MKTLKLHAAYFLCLNTLLFFSLRVGAANDGILYLEDGETSYHLKTSNYNNHSTSTDLINKGDTALVGCDADKLAAETAFALLCSSIITNFPYYEGFENTLGGWLQGSDDNFDWRLNSGGTPYSSTGPTAAAQGTHYVYAKASSPNYPSKNTILYSPCFDLFGVTDPTATFQYHMKGTSVGNILLEISDGSNWVEIWRKAGNQGSDWKSASINLSPYLGRRTIQLRFKVTTGSSYSGDIAIDDFRLEGSTTTITNFPYEEGFENTLGGWSQGANDNFDLRLRAGGTPSSGTGPIAAAQGTHYVYAEVSYPNYPSKNTILYSPYFNLSGVTNPTVTFQYHMKGTSVGNISLQMSGNGLSWFEIWSKAGDQGSDWKSTSINLSSYSGSTIQLRFKVTSGSSWRGDIAIDDFSIRESYCASNGNNLNYEYIGNVNMKPVNNPSGASSGGYGNFTHLQADLSSYDPSSTTISITPVFPRIKYPESYAVWIDFNQDGDFTDPGEQVLNQGPTTADLITGTIAIPQNAMDGPTRMRVSMKYNGSPTPCGDFLYGEVEDYTVVVFNGNSRTSGSIRNVSKEATITEIVPNKESTFSMRISPNPVSGEQLQLHINSNGAEAEMYTIYNITGQTIGFGNFTDTIDVSKLTPGLYILEVTVGDKKYTDKFIKN